MILTDTGFWVALINDRDHHHEQAKQVLSALNRPLVTTWPVVTETCYLLVQRVNVQAQSQFLYALKSGLFDLFELREDTDRLIELVKQYADLPMDLADASLVIAAEHLNTGDILSTDQRDFSIYRWNRHRTFNNLFFPEN